MAGEEGPTWATWASGSPRAQPPCSAHKVPLSLCTELGPGRHVAADTHRAGKDHKEQHTRLFLMGTHFKITRQLYFKSTGKDVVQEAAEVSKPVPRP